MIGEITSLEKIRISAHLAVQLGKPLTVNPYPVTHAAHEAWAKYYYGFKRIAETDKADLYGDTTRVCGMRPELVAAYGGRGVAP